MSLSAPEPYPDSRERLLAAPRPVAHAERGARLWPRFLVYLALAALLYFALRNAPLVEIWTAIRQLRLWQIGLIFLINAFVIASTTARWWTIVRAENPGIPFLPLIRYRLAVFGLSYFTPGPQVGGEPLQVLYLQRNHGISFARATSAVIMDKLLEFLANFLLIGAGLTAALQVGLLSRVAAGGAVSLLPMALILGWPIGHLVLLYHGRYPISSLIRRVAPVLREPAWARLLIVAERMAASFTRRRLGSLLVALGFSLLAWAGMTVEYFLIASFMNADLSFAQTLAALTAALVAFLMPLPGGLGALEASQVYALQAMGYAPAIGISISLVMRGRDILNGTFGLLLAGGPVRKQKVTTELS